MKIAALIFDMDGLLVDSEPLARLAMEKFLVAHDREIDPVVQKQLLGRRLPEAVAIVKEGYGLPEPVEELTLEYAALRLAEIRGSLHLMPGAAELVAYGKEKRLPMAVATSAMHEHAELSLGESGLAGSFDIEVTGDEVMNGKPAPDLFLLAAERLHISPEFCVVFEDAPNGVAAARAAGMTVAAVPNAQSREHSFDIEPDVTLPDLHAAIGWLEQLRIDCGQ